MISENGRRMLCLMALFILAGNKEYWYGGLAILALMFYLEITDKKKDWVAIPVLFLGTIVELVFLSKLKIF